MNKIGEILLMEKNMLTLTKKLEATLIHGTTKQEVEDVTLPAGTKIYPWSLSTRDVGDGLTKSSFRALIDGGDYLYDCFGAPVSR